MPDAAIDGSVRIFAGEFLKIGAGLRVWRTIGIAFKGNGGHGNDRTYGEPLFQIVIFWLALVQPSIRQSAMRHLSPSGL